MLSKELNKNEKSTNTKERIAVPNLNIDKFKNVLLYILEKCAGKPNVGVTFLYKLLYFSDFDYYELYEEHLTGAKYKKMPYGPVPQKFDTITEQMRGEEMLKQVEAQYHDHPQTYYFPLKKANLEKLKASEIEIIDRVIKSMSDWSDTEIKNYSLKDLPCEVTDEDNYISYELVFYRESSHTVRDYEEDKKELKPFDVSTDFCLKLCDECNCNIDDVYRAISFRSNSLASISIRDKACLLSSSELNRFGNLCKDGKIFPDGMSVFPGGSVWIKENLCGVLKCDIPVKDALTFKINTSLSKAIRQLAINLFAEEIKRFKAICEERKRIAPNLYKIVQ